MAQSYTQQAQQAQMPPAVDSSMQGAPGSPQLMGVQAQQPIPNAPMPGQGQYVNPALAASVLGLANLSSQQQGIDRQRKMADQMRQDAKGQLQGQQAGRVYKASGIANLGASLANDYVAGQLGQRADASTTDMNTQRQKTMQDYFNALTGNSNNAAGTGATGPSQ